MRSRLLPLLLALLPLSCLIAFFGVSIEASADEIEITKVSALTGRSFFGDTIPAKYYLGQTAYSFNFEYFASVASPSVGLNVDPQSIIPTPAGMSLYDFVVYKGTIPFLNQQVSKVEIDDFYLRFGDYARGGFALSTLLPDGLTTNFNRIGYAPNNYCGEFQAVCADYTASSNLRDYYGIMYYSPASGLTSFNFRTIYYDFDEGGVLDSLYFGGTYPYSQSGPSNTSVYYLIVICPYIGSSMSGDPPAETTTTSENSGPVSSINVNVDVDMTETNGLLGSILAALSSLGSSIVNGIKNIFLPDEQDIINWKTTIVSILNETFGGIPELENQLKNAITSIFTASARQTVTFEGIKVPAAAGQPEAVIVPRQEVSLKPSGFDDLFSWAETFINIVATIAVANTCFNQIKRVIVGEVVVDVD